MDRETFIQKMREMEARYGQEIITEDFEEEDELAEEVEHHTLLIFSCKLPVMFHTILIPWYTTGFH